MTVIEPTGPEPLAFSGVQAQLARIEELLSSTRTVLGEITAGPVPPATLPAISHNVIPRWHFAMLNDHERNDAYVTALERQISPGAHVLDIGSGSGLLAMAAARAGAGRVTTCETNPLLAEAARQIVAAEGLADRITVLAEHSTNLRVGEHLADHADLVISEIVDCGLVGEGLLPTVRDARARLLRPGGSVLPRAARLFGQLIESDAVRGLNHVDVACGFDVGLINSLATYGHFPTRLGTWPHRVLSEPVELLSFDFSADVAENHTRDILFTCGASGTAHAVAAWFELDLGAGVVLRNSPDNAATHWMQACVPFPEPVAVRAGEPVPVELSCASTNLFVRSRVPATTQEALQ